MDWIASILAIGSLLLISRKVYWAPIACVFVNLFWLGWELSEPEARGLILVTVVHLVVWIWAIPRWWKGDE